MYQTKIHYIYIYIYICVYIYIAPMIDLHINGPSEDSTQATPNGNTESSTQNESVRRGGRPVAIGIIVVLMMAVEMN